MQNFIDRFFRYVKIDTQSDPYNEEQFPSTEKQWDLARLLVKELKEMGLEDAAADDHAYVMATLPSNVDYPVPAVGFIAHMDTSPDFTATGVNPQIHPDYDGKDILLNKEKNIVMSTDYFPDLKMYKGQTLITTDGTTLLGADDKAGIVEIMEALQYLIDHPEIKHGPVKVAFTPDEEVGKGAQKFDVKRFGAEWAYTMDGSAVGELEYENFNAAGAKVIITGTSVHPGYAKDKLVNSMTIAAEFIQSLPPGEVPEHTEGREGFFHLHTMKGDVEHTELHYIIRDHDMEKFHKRKELIQEIAGKLNRKLGTERIQVELKDQYYNMREKVQPVMHVVEIAEEAMKSLGITPLVKPIRGGTDGSQLSYKGLPCPNVFAGGHNFHGKYEFIAVEAMQKAMEVIVKILEITAKRYA